MNQTDQCHKRRKPADNPVYYNFKNGLPWIQPVLEPACQAIVMVSEVQPEQLSTSDYYSYSKRRACSRDISA